jgi:hypothetical protein
VVSASDYAPVNTSPVNTCPLSAMTVQVSLLLRFLTLLSFTPPTLSPLDYLPFSNMATRGPGGDPLVYQAPL